MNANLWLGAVTTLLGAALGGAISFLLNRQQIAATRQQRLEVQRSEQVRRSKDRRLDLYADFLTHARGFRNAIRPRRPPGSGPSVPLEQLAEIARAADAAGSLVHLVCQNARTATACGDVMRTMGQTSGVLHQSEVDSSPVPWEELNERMSQVLRRFQAAARAELGIGDAAEIVVALG